ncbi:MAG: hypothetical protein ACC641_02545 [Acidiferrobacterales bacterium]
MKFTVNKLPVWNIVYLLLMIFILPTQSVADEPASAITKPVPNESGRYLFGVTLHTEKEIESLLSRAESLSHKLQPRKKNQAGIALVLHGKEIEMFDKKNYKKYRSIVDKAARLDANDVLEIKVCKTLMDELNIRKEDMPSFVEIVPYGPDEEKRLLKNGYTYL